MMRPRKTLLLALLLASVLLFHAQTRKTPAAAGTRNQDIAAAIQKLEEGTRLAALKGDAGWWDNYLADNFTDTDFRGKVSGKAEIVEMYRSVPVCIVHLHHSHASQPLMLTMKSNEPMEIDLKK